MGLFGASKKRKEEFKQKLESLGIKDKKKYFKSMEHINGLNEPERMNCDVGITSDNIIFLCGTNEYSIKINKLKVVELKKDIDTKIFNKNGSLIKGIAGGALFGVAGAIVGSQGKQKISREIRNYAIIGYESSDGEDKYIVLREKEINGLNCAKLVVAIKPLIKNVKGNKVEL